MFKQHDGHVIEDRSQHLCLENAVIVSGNVKLSVTC